MTPESSTRHVIYHGRVQGVGFRATTEHIARSYQVEGFVRNLPDGTVELVVRGEPAEIERFLSSVAGRFEAQIDQIDELPVTQEFSGQGFTIRR